MILATGPLTASGLASDLQNLLGDEYLYFYDALSPIVYADSIDTEVAFRASRYDEDGEGDYLNIPLSESEYFDLVAALLGMVLLVLVVTLLVRWTVPRRVLVLLAVVGFATASLGLLALPTRL